MHHSRNIAFDIDGTLVWPTGDAKFIEHLESQGYHFDHDAFAVDRSWSRAIALSKDELGIIYAEFFDSELYVPPPPMPGAAAALQELGESHGLHLVTSRSSPTAPGTHRHLAQHFSVTFSSAHFGALSEKAHRVQDCGATIFVEDFPKHALEVAEVAQVILVPHPYNRCMASHHRIITTNAHRRLRDDMPLAELEDVWRAAWLEIPELIRDVERRARQTQVRVDRRQIA
jgi:uncharacterized HAD superfamily protein